ncbi:hypothetical protein B5M09_011810 [Aphanomyces astaci]|uniref:Uncharacterized protein n=1 Tax=Aphanomyces astaci TaxID=112090 RepID=A0A425DJ96_APHAT|nr:hypothetical protein B5M09_011810 [Aphanomyces astaci]
MSPHSTCAPLYNGPPLDEQNRTFLEWKPLFVSQADGHEFTQFYLNKAYVPSDLEPSILSILDDDVQVDKLKQPELYSVADFTGDGLTVRHKAIATHIQSVKSATLKTELAKALSHDKQIWDLIRAISSNAKASGQPCSVASIDTAIKDALSTRHLRSLALGEHGTTSGSSKLNFFSSGHILLVHAGGVSRCGPSKLTVNCLSAHFER